MHKLLGTQYTIAQCQLLTGFTNELRHLFFKLSLHKCELTGCTESNHFI